MDDGRNELVDAIVRRVVEALRGAGAAAAAAGTAAAAAAAPLTTDAHPASDAAGGSAPGDGRPSVLVVLTGGTGSLDAATAALREIAAMPVRVDCVVSRAASRVHGTELLERLGAADVVDEAAGGTPFAVVSRSSVVVAPFLTQNTAVKVALGIRDSLASETLACAFLAGKPVVMATDSLALDGAPPAYRQSILRYVRTLESFGARMVRADRLAAEVRGIFARGPFRRMTEGGPAPGRDGAGCGTPSAVGSRLIDLRRAKDLAERAGEGGVVRIGPRTRVTLLAMDYLKERGIAVERAGEAAVAAAPGAGDES